MNRATRNKMVSATTSLTTGSACWETPPKVFEKLNLDFGPFDVDLTADPARHLCPVWFGPGSAQAVDVLADVDWSLYGATGFSNPPYGPFVQALLAAAQRQADEGHFTTTVLLPMRVTRAFKEHVLVGAAQLLFCDKRLTFFEDGVPRLNEKAWVEERVAKADPAIFDSILVRYVHGVRMPMPSIGIWRVPVHVLPEDLERAAARRTPPRGALLEVLDGPG